MLKNMGLLSWLACLVILAFQGLSWLLTGNWPSITLMDGLNRLFGLDLLSLAQNLPLDIAIKAAYVCFTTELALFLWWLGVAMFLLMFLLPLVRRK